MTISKLVGWKLVWSVGSTTVKLSGTLGEKRGERKRICSVWLGASFIFSRVSGITTLDIERSRNSSLPSPPCTLFGIVCARRNGSGCGNRPPVLDTVDFDAR